MFELNVIAKPKTIPPPEKLKAQDNGLKLKVGKRYVIRFNGKVTNQLLTDPYYGYYTGKCGGMNPMMWDGFGRYKGLIIDGQYQLRPQGAFADHMFDLVEEYQA